MSKKNLIPELRFPEFENEGEWNNSPLEDLCELITKGTTPTTLGYSYTNSGVNFIKIESILEGKINLDKAAFISKECNDVLKRSKLKEDDILFSIAGALGVVTTVNKEVLPANTNQALSIVRLKNKKQKDYVKWFLASNHIASEINKIKAGAAQPNISLNQVAGFNVQIPDNPKEQQKIASCLSSLDEVIEAHSQKLELLKNHKKGLMQNLFPQEGEKVPKLRFKEFEGIWEKISFGEVCISIASGKDKNEDNGEYELFGSTGIIGKTNNASYKGDYILVARVGANAGFLNRVNSKFGVTDNTLVISLAKNQSVDFIYYALENFGLNKLIFGSGQPLITGGQLKNLDLSFPTLAEQQKIACCLSSLDELIKAQEERIEQLKQHKKGLMQGLFPKMSE